MLTLALRGSASRRIWDCRWLHNLDPMCDGLTRPPVVTGLVLAAIDALPHAVAQPIWQLA